MTHARTLLVLCLTATAAAGAERPSRFGLTYTDNVLRCASALAGKVAVTDRHDMHGRSGQELVDCLMVQDLNTLVERIDGPYAFSVKAHFVVIAKTGSPLLKRPLEEMRVEPLLVTRDGGQVPSLPIRPEELDAIRATVRKDVRAPALLGKSLTLYLGRYSLGPRFERIVGLLSGGSRGRRVFLGRLNDGRLDLLWDSPLVDSGPGVELRDVDNDGVVELLFRSRVGAQEWALTMLSAGGKEMACEPSDTVSGMACVVVVAESSYFSKRPDGTLALVACPDPDRGKVYRFAGGRYVRLPPGTPIPPQTEP